MATTDEGGGLRAAALRYCQRAAVFPVEAGGKAPLIAGGFHGASRDCAQVEAWWQQWPDANVGFAIPDGLLVVDVDPRNGGATPSDLPPTRIAETAGGGWHLYYRVPHGIAFKRQAAQGVDLKAGGKGYVLLPPSRVNGGAYRWATDERAEIAALPGDLVDVLRRDEPVPVDGPARSTKFGTNRGLTMRAFALEKLATAREGTRNETLVEVAYQLARLIDEGELPEDETLHRLMLVGERTGLGTDEVTAVVRGAYDRALRVAR